MRHATYLVVPCGFVVVVVAAGLKTRKTLPTACILIFAATIKVAQMVKAMGERNVGE